MSKQYTVEITTTTIHIVDTGHPPSNFDSPENFLSANKINGSVVESFEAAPEYNIYESQHETGE